MNIPILLTLYAGFTHAFETDHILAVSNMVTSRNKTVKAVKDGMYWGIGHTSTIFLIGIVFLLLKFRIPQAGFKYFEAAVGAMLIILGVYRISQWYRKEKPVLHAHPHAHTGGHIHTHSHLHTVTKTGHRHSHLPAYLVGLVHGLAGSGALILVVMGKSHTVANGLLYLLIFGAGSVLGMMLAAGAFSLPFSRKILNNTILQTILIFISALLCIGYGILVISETLV